MLILLRPNRPLHTAHRERLRDYPYVRTCTLHDEVLRTRARLRLHHRRHRSQLSQCLGQPSQRCRTPRSPIPVRLRRSRCDRDGPAVRHDGPPHDRQMPQCHRPWVGTFVATRTSLAIDKASLGFACEVVEDTARRCFLRGTSAEVRRSALSDWAPGPAADR
jgi:hypothetical protein